MNRSMQLLFDSLHDGVMVVGRHGEMKYANQAARSIFGHDASSGLQHPAILRNLAGIESGYVALPVSLTLDREFERDLEAKLLPSPVGDDIMVVIRDDTDEHLYRTTIQNLMSLFHRVCHDEALRCLNDCSLLLKSPSEATLKMAGESWGHFSSQLQEVIQLASVHAGVQIQNGERLDIPRIVSRLTESLTPACRRYQVSLAFNGIASELPPVYGSETWLVNALAALSRALIAQTPKGGEIMLACLQHGAHVSFKFTSNNMPIAAHLRERVFLPFSAGVMAGAASAELQPNLFIGFALCKAILEMLGGHVRWADHDALDIVIELPTGAPNQSSPHNEVDAVQMERYARDLGRLLASRG
ncbi:PAS domain-containing protein [Burkholderiaceae bacterium DAT-1]|nr:PAS domain-containing protein [Burkholderiaceae bacterium DAT-1]